MGKRIIVWAGFLVVLLLAACGDDDAETATQAPVTTQAATTTTRAVTVGEPERGRQIWEDGGGALAVSSDGCSACHSLDGSEKVAGTRAPTWRGISALAGDRVPGLSVAEYLRESILDPSAYVVEGYTDNLMSKGFRIFLTDEDIDGLVAFLLTQ